MRTDIPQTIYLKDYKPFPFSINEMDLNFDIHTGYTVVTAKASYTRTNDGDLFLYGEDLEILSIQIDGKGFESYEVSDKGMTIAGPLPPKFTLEIQTKIYPEDNTRLEGLYNSGGTYCTQCEAEGFRRITFYPDRPDVLTTYTVRIEADKSHPVLLSNGNLINQGEVKEGRHFTTWHDPHPKPCYLFALVAGDLTQIHDTFTTCSGRTVDLYIYVRAGDENQCAHAMDSLKRSMKWDEEVYGLEYDLDIFNIVAVSDFNMGAMENKSLNIFNTALVLAHQDTATDQDFMRVEGVIAHEYFHNWSGNRVTCRDWFQLSLKEGLTVFRDQEFSADTHSKTVQRIDDVTHLRKFQFTEDASPLAHPIRPDNYIEINNFYTMTVYEKGAEVIRMMRTILGNENYRKGTDLYFKRHDGQAVTCDDFVQAMQDASGIDLSQFKLWYSQAGTPEVHFKGEYDQDAKSYTVTLSQDIPDTAGQSDKAPMSIPFTIGLLGADGEELCDEQALMLQSETQSFVIKDIAQKPTPSLLRRFSAPVKLNGNLTAEDLGFLMVRDTDGFNRWECGQVYALNTINEILSGKQDCSSAFISAYGTLLEQALLPDTDKAFSARALTLPDVGYIAQHHELADPPAIYNVRSALISDILLTHEDLVQNLYDENRTSSDFSVTAQAMGMRALQNCALSLLSYADADEIGPRAYSQYEQANNMTDRVAALKVLADSNTEERDKAFSEFYTRFKDYPLVIDKWFSLQAMATRDGLIGHLRDLKSHPDFNIKNPNRVRSLFSAFAMNNPLHFHNADGSGYAFLRDAVVELNDINPQIAARLLTPMRGWAAYSADRQDMIKDALSEILKIKNIAPDVFEIASKSLKHA
ncbi:MAG: aminopeptidase N [Alphaproteobacteria bacterium]